MSALMRSLRSSVGSKSSNDRRNLDLPNSYDQEESITALRSSWIRRLRLKLPPLQAQPPSAAQDGGTSPTPAVAAAVVPSSDCTTGSGGGDSNPPIFEGHRNTISTVESHTPASISNLRSAFFFRRLLDFHSERSGLEEENPSFSFSSTGFGPFQVRTRRSLVQAASAAGPSSPPSWARLTPASSDRLSHRFLDCKEAAGSISQSSDHLQLQDVEPDFNGIGNFGFNGQDSLADLDKFNYANYGIRIPFSRNKEEEEGVDERFGRSNCFPREQNFVDDGCRSSSFQQRRVAADDHHRSSSRLSPFFQFQPSPVPIQDMTKKREYLRESRMNPFLQSARDGWLFGGPLGDANKKFIDSDPTSSRNLNRPRPLGDDKAYKLPLVAHDLIYDAPDQRMYEQRHSADPLHCSSSIHGIKYISRSRGSTAYHDSGIDDSAACRTILDPPLMHHNIVRRQAKRQVPACPHEPEEPYSFWNMERIKRPNDVSSSLLEFPLSRSSSRKRYTDIDEFVSTKFRKLGAAD
ncbi:uncharacterized protein LOC131222724 isoform X2 [Magnolia sinica]|uniref:uncharacterized protein LOC131222724 isoform X2 n=1 Tax=Magnolia sinica TaxID=86752 RepID=UPI0026588F56|nr:uncharacterized protein LOC131222724 isoform X2 [Magnolia sinica]